MGIPQNRLHRLQAKGFSLVELAVVLAVIIIIASVTALSVPAWRNAASRSACQTNMAQVQQAMRSYATLNYLNYGAAIEVGEFLGADQNFHVMPFPQCPQGGRYSYFMTVPSQGIQFSYCNLPAHTANMQTDGW